jgi:hypothetical protein
MTTHREILKDEYGPAMNWYKCTIQISISISKMGKRQI